jgi:hypothetical protein
LSLIQASQRSIESKSFQSAQTYIEALRTETPDLPTFDVDKATTILNVPLGKDHGATQKTG